MSTDTAKMTTYVTYYYPGLMVSETSTREVPDRNPQRSAQDAPEGAFAFTFHDIASVETEEGGKPLTLKSLPLRESARYYIDAEKLTVADIEALDGIEGDYRILLSNMRSNGWDAIVRCRTGNFQPLKDGDEIVSSGS